MIATTIEQSKHLLELGLDPKTAGMYYQKVLPKSDKIEHNPKVGNPVAALEWYNKGYTHFGKSPLTLEEFCVPAWSLSALLEVMPNNDYWEICLWQYKDQQWQCVFDDVEFSSGETKGFTSKDPLTAAFEMVCYLLEQGLIKKEEQD